MKWVDVSDFRSPVDECLALAETDDVVLLAERRPHMLLQVVPDDVEAESLDLGRSPESWAMIRQRRQEVTIPGDVAKQQLLLDPT